MHGRRGPPGIAAGPARVRSTGRARWRLRWRRMMRRAECSSVPSRQSDPQSAGSSLAAEHDVCVTLERHAREGRRVVDTIVTLLRLTAPGRKYLPCIRRAHAEKEVFHEDTLQGPVEVRFG